MRTAELGLSTIKALVVPRASLSSATQRQEIKKTGVYVLIGQDLENPTQKRIYIGEGDILITRISAHNKDPDKDFWDEVVLFISKDDNLTKSHVRYMEARLIALAKAAKRSEVTNETAPETQGKLPEPDEVEMDEFVAQARLLLGALGLDIFEPSETRAVIAQPQFAEQQPAAANIPPEFKLSGEDFDATCVVDLNAGQFIVKVGSQARKVGVSALSKSYINLRAQLIQSGVLQDASERSYQFSQDYAFSAPTPAAQVVSGSTISGRTAWRSVTDNLTFAEWQDAQLTQNGSD
jgi:hypothetical protein